MIPLADQLRALGLDGVPVITEFAELDGDRFDPTKTVARLRTSLEFYEGELAAMRAFSAKWGAPMDEVTDNYDEYRAMAARIREGIQLPEKHVKPDAGSASR